MKKKKVIYKGWEITIENQNMIARKWGFRLSVKIRTTNRDTFEYIKRAIKAIGNTAIAMKEQKRRRLTQEQIQAMAGTPLPTTVTEDVMNPFKNKVIKTKGM